MMMTSSRSNRSGMKKIRPQQSLLLEKALATIMLILFFRITPTTAENVERICRSQNWL
ncbi:unnamed protein product [Brassica napus]|uniref:(rape) hypothetical protein n=1 Tax=Brassica napus TaxID=3708 RepID=A0A817A0D9_BRANA|nr:unnamed protein product [Brassica napus]